MTIATQTNVSISRGNGATVTFPFNFKVIEAGHLSVERRVYATGLVDKTYSESEYTLAGLGGDSGSVTILGDPLSSDYEVVIRRTVPYKQELDIVNQGGFYPNTVEEQLDLITMQIQQVAERSGRSLTVPAGSAPLDLPIAAVRAGYFLAFNAAGDPIVTEGIGSDASLRPDLASPVPGKGAALVETQFGNLERVVRASVGETRIDAKLGYGAAFPGLSGSNEPGDTTKLQALFDNVPNGSTIHFPQDSYRTEDTVSVTRQIAVEGHGARVSGFMGSDPTKDLFKVAIAEPAPNGGDVRGWQFQNLVCAVNEGGRDCLRIEKGPLAGMFQSIIRGNRLSVPEASPGAALRITEVPSSFHVIEDNTIINQVWLDRCADGCRIFRNMILGQKPSVKVDVVEGAFRTQIVMNTLLGRDGAVEIYGGSEVDIFQNQIEQQGVNANALVKSHIIIYPSSQKIRDIQIVSNNFGGGTNLDYSIWAKGPGGPIPAHCDIEGVFIDRNVFNRTSDGNYDIVLYDAGVRYTKIGPNNRLRGIGPNRGNVDWADINLGVVTANTLNAQDLLRIVDNGLGTYGVWKGPSTLNLQNGWGPGTFRYRKSLDSMLQFRGLLAGASATLTVGTVIGTLPEGFRPPNRVYVTAEQGGTQYLFSITAAGEITVAGTTPPATAQCRISESFYVNGEVAYDPGH